MGNTGSTWALRLIAATLKENPQIKDQDSVHRDANAILEALLAEYSRDEVLEALSNHGYKPGGYSSNLKHLQKVARSRRKKRIAGSSFNPEQMMAEYRKASEALNSTKGVSKTTLEDRIKKMRQKWKEWQGEDSLHETAFGEPVE